MSPEVLQGSGYDFQCDVWSLGCIAYEFCALRSPFKDENKKMSLYDLFQKIIKADYTPLSSSRYSAELLYIIDQMLIVNPDERANVHDVLNYCQQQIDIMEKKDSVRQNRASKLSRAGNESVTESANVTIDNDGYTSGTPGKKSNCAVDPCLIMDDIIEKLQLLEYVNLFCHTRGHKPVSRTYFAVGQ